MIKRKGPLLVHIALARSARGLDEREVRESMKGYGYLTIAQLEQILADERRRPTSDQAHELARLRVEAWSVDDFVSFAISTLAEEYLEDPERYAADSEELELDNPAPAAGD